MILPRNIKESLEKNRLYLRFRYSRLIYGLWLMLRADVRNELSFKKELYDSVLPKECKLIFDIGANEGALTQLFSQHAQTVVAVEASERNIAILSAKFRSRKNIIVVPKAVSSHSGFTNWFEDKTNYAMGTLNRKWNDAKQNTNNITTRIETVTLDDLVKLYGAPDYIKIDVEGHELQVLQGLNQRISLLSFEAILPLFRDETVSCINRLLCINPCATFNYTNERSLFYKAFQKPDLLLHDIMSLEKTTDIFCML